MRPPAIGIRSALMLCCAMCLTPSPASALFIVNQPWVRPATIGQTTEAYVNLTSTDGAKLVAVRTEAAEAVAIRAPGTTAVTAPGVTLPPGKLIALAPGRYRIALKKLLRTLHLGDRVLLTLRIEQDDGSQQDIPMDAEVRLRSPIDDERRAHSHTHAPH